MTEVVRRQAKQRCAAYLRKAYETDKPVKVQLENCAATAAIEELTIPAHLTFADEDAPARITLMERPGFASLVSSAESNSREFDTLIVDEPSRFARSISEVLGTFSMLSRLGIRVVVASPQEHRRS
jgi:DNA invertase Pin-like site-specific DNA recombinase